MLIGTKTIVLLRYVQGGIVYCCEYQFHSGFIYSAHLKSQTVHILLIYVFSVAKVT